MQPTFNYTPFPSNTKPPTVEDLNILKTVSEGWYIEYKRELPKGKNIAKSISAFANTYGGWLFIGISEKSKTESTAGGFPGIDDSLVESALQSIRSGVATTVVPPPHFEIFVLKGPCEDLPLDAGKSIICIRVPWSPNTPHVSGDGQIFRRVGEGSEPKPETDRNILDQLWQRRNAVRKHYKNWLSSDPKPKKGCPVIRILLTADIWRTQGLQTNFGLNEVRRMFSGDPNRPGMNLPFDTIHEVANGFVARQTKANDPSRLLLTWKLNHDLSSEFFMPLNTHYGDFNSTALALQGYRHNEAFSSLLQKAGYKTATVVDLNHILMITACVVDLQKQILEAAGLPERYYAKIQTFNTAGTVPFLDMKQFIDDCKQFGIPQCLTKSTTWPEGFEPDSFREVHSDGIEVEDASVRQMVVSVDLHRAIWLAFGVSFWKMDEVVLDYEDLLRAGHLARNRQNVPSDA